MSKEYYQEINKSKDIIKLKLQLGSILLKLNEHNLNISNINNNITKIKTDIKNNDIESNYHLCIGSKNSLIDIDKKVYSVNNTITKINNDNDNINNNTTKINSDINSIKENNENIIKYNYTIENIWFYSIDKLNTYTITPSKPVISLFEYIIQGKFITN